MHRGAWVLVIGTTVLGPARAAAQPRDPFAARFHGRHLALELGVVHADDPAAGTRSWLPLVSLAAAW